MLSYNHKLKQRAQKFRSEPTNAEALLWERLRRKSLDGCQWYRQKPLGNYVVDFFCPAKKLVVEADGDRHFEKAGREYDDERNVFFEQAGLKVLRFRNCEICTNIDGVLARILRS